MAQVTFQGSPISTNGNLPAIGQVAPDFRSSFSNDYGVTLTESPLHGLTARAVVVLNEQNQVLHAELVSEIANEPDYEAALTVL